MSSLFDTATPHPAGYREVEVRPLFDAPRDDLALVDVREPAELDGLLGHIAGVQRAPLSTVPEVVRDWPRQAPVVLVCRSGARSARAAVQLVGLGFTRVMNMRGGMLAWNTAQLPVVRADPAPLPSVEAVRDALFQGLHQLLAHAVLPAREATDAHEHRDSSNAATRDAHSPSTAAPLSRLALAAVLDALQAARPPDIRDAAAFDLLLRDLKDQLAVARARPEGLT
ncbi:Rhodanese-related sulfurtransferase [Myxococcus hansupus]|uniref:Rhodanese-related sulfurtransferase n=1 Tax=Pseudomyxococcus hansupus TaxID=1297742 RepID=A0A0H4X2M6_9BACT|nr:rhodanese-like domain-containing protein [Myxococcus hansupus]AKQ69906.1 Rhodanese-related sulfurtransferase [Myxococcus hansupus]